MPARQARQCVYELIEGKERYSVDALMGRIPQTHERLARQLRREIIDARDIGG